MKNPPNTAASSGRIVESELKPRLVFFQWQHDGLPQFLRLHMLLHVKCLAEFFEVVVINQDCDYQEVCDTHQPDLALFESGYRTSISKKIAIKNTAAHPSIPKLGLHNGDAWCECRSGFISDMEHWGIDTFFTICTTTAEHTPELSENLFVWPNFIDGEIFRDYGQAKAVPVLFNGLINALYPWRQKIFKVVSNRYPAVVFPHLGYDSQSPVMIHGEQYARTINTAWFVPACGTLAKEVVRKHFEIPGANACLVAEKTPSLEAAGFVDMQNCVFADQHNVLDKLNHLFQHTDELETIIKAGHQLAHTRHTAKQRDQLYSWFMLHKNLKPTQKIVQANPFEPLRVVDISSGVKSSPVVCDGLNLVLLRQGDKKLWSGNYEEAEGLYLECLNYIHWMCEPKLKLAICNLFKGDANRAHDWVIDPIQNNLSSYKAFDPDPVEWAYFIIALLCQGKWTESVIRASQYPALRHPELDRARLVIRWLKHEAVAAEIPAGERVKSRYTVHQLPKLSLEQWINNICNMLMACRQEKYAGVLQGLVARRGKNPHNLRTRVNVMRNTLIEARIMWLEKLEWVFDVLRVPNPRPGLPPLHELNYVIRLCRWAKLDHVKRISLRYVHSFRASWKALSRANAVEIEKASVKLPQ